MNFASLNLNLLVVFDAVMSERSLTKAGQSLGLSQPAISHSLSQLRHMLGDPLFVRSKGEMRPTPRAREIAGPIRSSLEQIKMSLEQALPFDPRKCDLCFRIGMTDYTAFALLGPILRQVRGIATRSRIQVRAITPTTFRDMLEDQEIDLCVASAGFSDNATESEVLFNDHWICARGRSSRSHEEAISLSEYLSASHVVVGEEMVNHVDRLLGQRGLKRKNVVSMPFCLVTPTLVEHADVIATLPRRIAAGYAASRNISLYHLPFATRGFPVRLAWNKRHVGDPPIAWLRNLIIDTCKDTTTPPQLDQSLLGSRIDPMELPAVEPAELAALPTLRPVARSKRVLSGAA